MFKGFVYIWRDKKHNRYYIGSHKGNIDDGYICSSSWMKSSYKRRPYDFSRKILGYCFTSRKELFELENYWLSKIKEKELGVRYYNFKKNTTHWSSDPDIALSVGQKISKRHKGRKAPWSAKPKTDEQKQKISNTLKGRPINYIRTSETRAKIAENSRRLVAEGKVGMLGRVHSEDTKKLMSNNNAMNNPEYRAKVKAVKKGIRWMSNGTNKKMAVPGTEKFIMLEKEGYRLCLT